MNPLSQYLVIGKLVALLGAIAIICFQSSQIHKWHLQSDGNALNAQHLQDALDGLAAQSKQQQATTQVVDHYITVTKPGLIRERVKIESAPLPGNCRTPQEVLNADI